MGWWDIVTGAGDANKQNAQTTTTAQSEPKRKSYWEEMTKPESFDPAWSDKQDKFGEPLVLRPLPKEPKEKASMLTSIKSGMMEDDNKKIEVYAKARFPDMPIEESMKRYGKIEGNIVFVDKDGTVQKETGAISRFIGEQSLPISGAISGGVVAGIPGAVAGGSIGLAARKLGAQSLGDVQTSFGNAIDFAVEGALNSIGWGGGKGVGAAIDRKVVKDISNFDKRLAEQVIAKGKSLGIDVTPAEASDLGSLISQQTRLGMGFDEAGDLIRKFYQKRVGQVDAAISQVIGKSSPASVAGKNIREASIGIIRNAQDARTNAVTPLYEKALDSINVVPKNENLSKLMGSSTLKDSLAGAMKILDDDIALGRADAKIREYFIPVKEYSKGGRYKGESLTLVKEPTIRAWDYVRRGLDNIIEEGKDSITGKLSPKAERAFAIKNELLKELDSASPDYFRARQKFSSLSPEINNMKSGMLGVLSKVKDPALLKSADNVFNSANIDVPDVLNLKHQFTRAGYSDQWDDFLGSWLRKKWEGVAPTQTGNQFNSGATFKQTVFGTKRQQEVMQAAMGPSRFKAFSDLMDVLEAISKVPKSQSMTEPAMQAAKQEAYEAAPIASKMGSSPLSPIRLREWWLDTRSRSWRETMAKVITSPDAITELEKLRKLKSLSNIDSAALGIVGDALTKAGVYGAANYIGTDMGAFERSPTKTIDERVLRDLQ